MMKVQKIIKIILMILLYLSALGMYLFYGKNHVLIICLIILIVWGISNIIWSTFFKHIRKNIIFYFLNFVLLYILLNVGTFSYDKYLNYKLNQFDLNKDSVFSIEEQTLEQQKYMDMVTSDLGRNFMFIIGGIISIISTFILFLFVVVFKFIKKYFKNTVHT